MSGSADREFGGEAPVASLALERIVRSPATFVENLPIGIYTCDRVGNLVQFNRRAAELWGYTPVHGGRLDGHVRMLDLGGKELDGDRVPMAEVLTTAKPIRDRELLLERSNGERLTVVANVDPLFDEQGNLVGGVNCFQDISETRRMQQQMREGRRLGRRVMEALPAAVYTTDAEGKLLYFNRAAEALWGRKPELGEEKWCGGWKLYAADGAPLPHEQSPMAVALREKRAMVGPEGTVERPDGSRIPFMPHPTPIFDSNGELIGAVNMLIDLTEQKRANSAQQRMIAELNHRVKNTLATIQSLAAQTMRGPHASADREFESRLLALSKVHDQLTRHAWEWADFAIIANDTFACYRGSANSNIHLRGRSQKLDSRSALATAMVLHELASNSAKHGALSTPTGSVDLSWDVEGRTLTIRWEESGGPAVVTPRKRGFGLRLLERSIAHELGGRPVIQFAPDGVQCTMEIPLPA